MNNGENTTAHRNIPVIPNVGANIGDDVEKLAHERWQENETEHDYQRGRTAGRCLDPRNRISQPNAYTYNTLPVNTVQSRTEYNQNLQCSQNCR